MKHIVYITLAGKFEPIFFVIISMILFMIFFQIIINKDSLLLKEIWLICIKKLFLKIIIDLFFIFFSIFKANNRNFIDEASFYM